MVEFFFCHQTMVVWTVAVRDLQRCSGGLMMRVAVVQINAAIVVLVQPVADIRSRVDGKIRLQTNLHSRWRNKGRDLPPTIRHFAWLWSTEFVRFPNLWWNCGGRGFRSFANNAAGETTFRELNRDVQTLGSPTMRRWQMLSKASGPIFNDMVAAIEVAVMRQWLLEILVFDWIRA